MNIQKLKEKQGKKGIPLNQAFGAILTLVLVGVLVIIAIFIFASLAPSLDNQATSGTNQTVTAVSETEGQVINSSACDLNGVTVISVNNATGDEVITSANYTVSDSGVILSTGNDARFNNTDWNITYSGLEGGDACRANKTMIEQFATYPVLVGLVGTIIFLGLVIGVLVASFVFGGKGGV